MENEKEQVSIILPVYNVSEYLERCLNSILNQTYISIEIIAVNDGSTDSSLEILEKYKKIDSRINIVSKPNGGLMSAWLEGLKYATGNLITFVDSDDWIDKDYIEKMHDVMCSSGADMVVLSYQEEWNDGTQKIIHNQLESGLYQMNSKVFSRIINYDGGYRNRGVVINRWGKLMRRELIQNNIGYCDSSISYGEDVNIMIPAFGSAKSIYVLDEALYHYRMNQKSITHSYIRNMKNQVDTLYEKIKCYTKDTNQPENVLNAIKLDYLSLIICCMRNEAKNKNVLIGTRKIMEEYMDDKWEKVVYTTSINNFSFINRMLINGLKKKSIALTTCLLIVVKIRGNY